MVMAMTMTDAFGCDGAVFSLRRARVRRVENDGAELSMRLRFVPVELDLSTSIVKVMELGMTMVMVMA